MEIVYKLVSELKEYENNPRDNSVAVSKLVESIREVGFINPISITADNIIISGHTRLQAAKILELEKVPCIIQELSDEDARLARIIDNKSNEFSTWDVGKLQAEVDSIPGMNISFFKNEYRDVKSRINNLALRFGKVELPVTEDEYLKLKAVFDDYINRENTYLGFLGFLLEGK